MTKLPFSSIEVWSYMNLSSPGGQIFSSNVMDLNMSVIMSSVIMHRAYSDINHKLCFCLKLFPRVCKEHAIDVPSGWKFAANLKEVSKIINIA